MIKKRTVLVLGAGASIPFGFPSGKDLYYEIAHRLPGDAFREAADERSYIFPPEEVETFKIALLNSGEESVDSFLAAGRAYNSYNEIGKAAIAWALIPREEHGMIVGEVSRGVNWYRHLWRSLSDASFTSFARDNRLAIITFNYDRSIEQFLFTALKARYTKSDKECAQVMAKIPLVHVHGQLGPLPWQANRTQLDVVPFNGERTPDAIRSGMANIKIMKEQDGEYDGVRPLLSEAEKIIFLGFGYHADNLQRLGIAELDAAGKTIVGTCLGMKPREISSIHDHGKLDIDRDVLGQGCLEFLRNNVTFD